VRGRGGWAQLPFPVWASERWAPKTAH